MLVALENKQVYVFKMLGFILRATTDFSPHYDNNKNRFENVKKKKISGLRILDLITIHQVIHLLYIFINY